MEVNFGEAKIDSAISKSQLQTYDDVEEQAIRSLLNAASRLTDHSYH